MSKQVDLVLFDFGGVFTESPFSAVEGMARDMGLDTAKFAELMFGAYHLDNNHPWHRLERGEISFDQAREDIMALGREVDMLVDPIDLLMRMAGGNLIRESMVQVLRDIKAAGYPVAIITNNVREFRDGWRALIPVDELVDRVFDSSELGVRKPDPAIFLKALDGMGGVDASRAVFLDDVEQNVLSARDLGMHGIHVQDNATNAIQELRETLHLR